MKKSYYLISIILLHIFVLFSKTYRLDFGGKQVQKGYLQVSGDMVYSESRGYGFSSCKPIKNITRQKGNQLNKDFCTSEEPFYFFIDLPEGNYKVDIILGDQSGKSINTVKAESRRLILNRVITKNGQIKTKTFSVNVRRPKINQNDSIIRNPREYVYLNWDNKLSLEFNNKNPKVAGLKVTKIQDVTTIFLAGNSTVTDQEYVPWAAWGQMLPYFFDQNITVANYAESGSAMKNFIASNRLKKIKNKIGSGDYLFIQFGHNDQKKQSSAYLEPNQGYKKYLKKFVKTARKFEATPVLIPSMHRRKFDNNGNIINTHGEYPQAVREVARETNVALIDLTKMSKKLYEALGVKGSQKAFVHYPANTFPGQNKKLSDNSHHSVYGAFQLAKCIVKGIKRNNLRLIRYFRNPDKSYEPGNPDPFQQVKIPYSPSIKILRPKGN